MLLRINSPNKNYYSVSVFQSIYIQTCSYGGLCIIQSSSYIVSLIVLMTFFNDVSATKKIILTVLYCPSCIYIEVVTEILETDILKPAQIKLNLCVVRYHKI